MNQIEYIQKKWENLTFNYPPIKEDFLGKILAAYNSPKRHYHNLTHIEALLKLIDEHEHLLDHADMLRLVTFYHDIVYNATKSNNELKSAQLAQKHLKELGVNESITSTVYKIIIATQTHQLPTEIAYFDAQFFLDIDLSILASSAEKYTTYTTQIRKEYSIYPAFMYNKGRKKVLKHFLELERIYKTDLLYNLYEQKARQNLLSELASL